MGPGGGGLASAGVAEVVVGAGFHRDTIRGDVEGRGEVRTHRVEVRPQLDGPEDDEGVEVDDLVAVLADIAGELGDEVQAAGPDLGQGSMILVAAGL